MEALSKYRTAFVEKLKILNTKEIPRWSEWREIFTHEGVMSQSQIDDGDISSDKLRNEYIMGRIEYRKLKITLEE